MGGGCRWSLLVLLAMMLFLNGADTNRRSPRGDFLFPDEFESFKKKLLEKNGTRNKPARNDTVREYQFPLDLARRMNQVDDFEEFLSNHVTNKDDLLKDLRSEVLEIEQRFGSGTKKTVGARSGNAPVAKHAACVPESTVVPLVNAEAREANVIHVPSCTRVLRCTGCCNSNLLQCEPTEVAVRQFKVYELTHNFNQNTYKKLKTVQVDEHIKCECACRMKEHDCNAKQYYSIDQCRCNCRDLAAQQECNNRDDAYWNYDTCECECLELLECSTGK